VLRSTAHLRRCAELLLSVIVLTLSAPALASGHLEGRGRLTCPESALGSAHPVEQFESVLPSVDAEHCPLCHWMRAVSNSVPVPMTAVGHVDDPWVKPLAAGELVPVFAVAHVSASRAPPAAA